MIGREIMVEDKVEEEAEEMALIMEDRGRVDRKVKGLLFRKEKESQEKIRKKKKDLRFRRATLGL